MVLNNYILIIESFTNCQVTFYHYLPGYVSYRDRLSGSFFIQSLLRAMDRAEYKTELLDLLQQVKI